MPSLSRQPTEPGDHIRPTARVERWLGHGRMGFGEKSELDLIGLETVRDGNEGWHTVGHRAALPVIDQMAAAAEFGRELVAGLGITLQYLRAQNRAMQ